MMKSSAGRDGRRSADGEGIRRTRRLSSLARLRFATAVFAAAFLCRGPRICDHRDQNPFCQSPKGDGKAPEVGFGAATL